MSKGFSPESTQGRKFQKKILRGKIKPTRKFFREYGYVMKIVEEDGQLKPVLKDIKETQP